MSCNWSRVQISEVCELIVDCVNKTAPRVDYETPFRMIRTPNVKGGKISLNDCRFVEEDTYEKWTRRAKVLRDDILLTREAPMGEVGIVDFDDTVFLGQRIMQYRVDRSKCDPHFLLYSFLSSDLQHQFNMHEGSGSVVSHIRVPDCSKFELDLPPLNIQKKIADVLKQLDRKISVNTQINQTLEAMAQAIFKSWFVDFEPVKAKMNGEQPKGVDAATASLFPEKLVESELGLIPEGWDAGTLSDVAKYCSARTSIDRICLDNYISTENMLADRKGVTAASKLPTAKMVAAYKTGDVLVSNIRPYFKKIWLAEGNGGRSNDVLGFESSVPNTDAYIMNLLYQDTFFEYMTRTSKGAKMPRGDKTAIMNWEIAVPPVELREAYTAIVDKFYKLIPQNRAQNETLESLRDTLLPKLLSGEIELDALEVGNS